MFFHQPVLLREVLQWLSPTDGDIFVDGTVGGGGHSEAILRQGATVYGIDRDEDALRAASGRLSSFSGFHAIHGNYHDMDTLLAAQGIRQARGILLDLGVSSYQLDTPERGFSYHADAPLDMRMDRTQALTAEMLVNTWDADSITRVLRDYAEEPWAARIAAIIAEHRVLAPFRTTGDLVRAVDAAIPRKIRNRDKGHPAQRTFQALRIAVNDELNPLAGALDTAMGLLMPQGRLCVITFHSLEDRIVKQAFRRMENPCVCPPSLPFCVCGAVSVARLPARGAIKPSAEEIHENPRARSAKLRVAQRR